MKFSELARRAFDYYRQGKFKSAELVVHKALEVAPRDPNLLQLLAAVLLAQNRAGEAVSLLERVVNTDLATADTMYNLGTALAAAGRHKEAVERLRQASHARPQDADCHSNLGIALLLSRQYADAEESFGRALKLRPNWAAALQNWGRSVAGQGRHQEALDTYSHLISNSQYSSAELMLDIGSSFRELKRPTEALAAYERALVVKPGFAEAHNNRGNVLIDLQRPGEALASYDRALALKPDIPEAYQGRGNALVNLRRPAEALASYDRALALTPGSFAAYHGRGNALMALKRPTEALADYERALAVNPHSFEAHHGRGSALKDLHRLDESLESYGHAVALQSENLNSLSHYVHVASRMCDWNAMTSAKTDLLIACKYPTFDPFPILSICDDPAVQQATARGYITYNSSSASAQLEGVGKNAKLRIGYLSADFRQHPVAVLIVELIELHDRSRFEIYGFCSGPDDRSPLRHRIETAFDVFVDVRGMSDAQLRQTIQAAQIDIVVDLGGPTADGRMLALAQRTAPIQVAYLGYPGTVGAPFIDYAIVDNFVVPDGGEKFFTEKLVYLPHCYMVSDRKRPLAPRKPLRSEFELPDRAFVFCSFTSPHKINPAVFDTWMHILTAIPNGALWLVHNNKWASENLRKEAELRGVDPDRLVFAPHLGYSDHLAALRLADLFLDTWPYNAHTTTNDALWVGLPVLTYSGRSFASRVAGSLLHAIGLAELVTYSQNDYEALAINLARAPGARNVLRQRLVANAEASPLFKTDRFARHIEAAFAQMWRRYRCGESPESFAVEALP